MLIEKKTLIVSLLLLFLTLPLFAGSFRHINVENGLSSRKVFQVAKDSAGFMWFFTYMGVDRYDGSEIRHYVLDEKLEAKDHILNSTMMVNDRDGHLWISLRNGKVYSYNAGADRFDTYLDATKILPGKQNLLDILFDEQNRLWLCFSSGLYLYEPESGRLCLIHEFPGEQVTRVEQYQENTFFVGTSAHLYRLTVHLSGYSLDSVVAEKYPIDARIESIFIDPDQLLLYAGTFSNSTYLIHTETNAITSLSHIIPSFPVRSIAKTRKGEILIGTDGSGFYSLDSKNHTLLYHYINDEDNPSGIAGNTVSSIYVDERNCIWVSTSTNGISILDPQYPNVQWTRHEFMNPNSLQSNHVNALLEDSEGDIWYGTNDGVSLYRTSTHQWTHFLNNREYAHVVLTLSEDDQKNIWVGGFGIGVYKIHKPSGRIQKMPIRKDTEIMRGISTEYIFSIFSDHDYIWFGGIEGDLTRYNTQDDSYAYYPFDCVGDIKAKDENTLLLATCEALGIFNKTNGKVEWHKVFDGKRLRYPIRCLLQTSSGEIWMATDGEGLISFNPVTGESVIYTTENGLSSNSFNNLLEAPNDHIWFTTEKDIYCINTQTRMISGMNEFINVEWGSFNPNATIRKRNDHLAFGTANGAIEFSPSFSFDCKASIELLFTEFRLFNKPVRMGESSPLRETVDKTNFISLKYAQNTFSFHFSALNFIYPNQIEYQYKLNHFDEEWRSVRGGNRLAEYTNIPSGRYQFQLKAIHKFTREEIGCKQLNVTVGKPFWLSSWALVFYTFCLLGVVIFVSYKVTRRIREQQEREEFDLSVEKARIQDILQDKEQSQTLLATTGPAAPEEIVYPSEQEKEFHANALRVIERQLSDPNFSVNEFCQELGMSRTSVYTRIKALTDQAPQDFIRTIRLKKAKELLKSKKYTIGEVALMVGFSDPKYFSTSFKKQFGVSPSKAE